MHFNREDQSELLQEARQYVAELKSKDAEEHAGAELDYYLFIMESVSVRGFVAEERQRVQAALDAASEQEKPALQRKLNVLGAFSLYRCHNGEAGCIHPLDIQSATFQHLSNADMAEVIKETEAFITALETEAASDLSPSGAAEVESELASARTYLSIMQRVLNKGSGYLESESSRVGRLLGSSVSDKKKAQLKRKLAILRGF
eukprot:NODE_698_length_1971_cov_27.006243_g646_i0.p1 GENE.NODE_698_length_1971_cov_27.006243_g646_i0~~NODE_698_length_1971_cov_27.006243_g646_i0.p1  ORF type:complete len:203 (-),score=51.63 NODE_698_length_1971_cov_27.006243_g646_i0:152-760(-)